MWAIDYDQYIDFDKDMQQNNSLNYEPQIKQLKPQSVSPVEQLKSAINLAETMPPSKLRKNLIGLINLSPEIEDHLMQKVYLPLQIEDSDSQNPFLKTQFNRDGDSYRSNITNQYYPHAQGYIPTPEFRKVQELGNILFAEYTKLYYGNNAIGNFFLNESADKNVFSCGFFAKKQCNDGGDQSFKGNWDSYNIADVAINGNEATLNVTTTILIQMDVKNQKSGNIDLTGFLKQSKTEKRKLSKEILEDIIVAFGEIVQDLETVMRQRLEAIYIGKTKEVIFTTRFQNTVQQENQRKSLAQGLKSIHLRN